MAITLNSKYKPLFESDKRFIVVTGGRGSAKSFSVNTFLTLLSYEKGHKVLFTRYTMKSAGDSIIPEFKNKIERFGVESQFESLKDRVTNRVTGSEILFRGIKTSEGTQTANLKSLEGITTLVVDEAEELTDEETFNKISLSVRQSGVKNRIILILNPTTREHWIWKRWFEKTHVVKYVDGCEVYISTHPNVCHIHTTYLDNIENLTDDYLNNEIYSIKKEYPFRYATEIIGGWKLQEEGALWKRSELKRFNPAELKTESAEAVCAYIDVADEGDDAYCMVIAHIFQGRFYVKDVVFTKLNADYYLPVTVETIKHHDAQHAAGKCAKLSFIWIETNNQGSIVKKFIRDQITDGVGRVIGLNNKANKHTRIITSQMNVKNDWYFLADEHIEPGSDYYLFMLEIFGYLKDGKSKHDDAPDAVSGLNAKVRHFFSHLFS